MPVYEFMVESTGEVIQEIFPSGKAPDTLLLSRDGEQVEAKRQFSSFGFNAFALGYQRTDGDEMAAEREALNKPNPAYGFNPKTGTSHTAMSYLDVTPTAQRAGAMKDL